MIPSYTYHLYCFISIQSNLLSTVLKIGNERVLNNLYYITYQNFPDYTANSRQTLSNIKYFLQEGYKVELIFPLRSEQSSSKIKNLQNFYNFEFN